MFLKQKFKSKNRLFVLYSIVAVFMLTVCQQVVLAANFNESVDSLRNKFGLKQNSTKKDEIFVIDENGTLVEYNGFIQDVTLPDRIKSIGNYAFSGHNEIKSITLPEGLVTIGQYAFSNCTSLEYLAFPDSVESLEYYALSGCTRLKSIRLGRGVRHLGEMSLWYCPALKKIEVDQNNPLFASFRGVLYSKNLDILLKCPESFCGAFIAPTGIRSISARAFSNCNKLTEIIFEDGVEDIGEAAFIGCTSLMKIRLGNTVRSVGSCAFSDCSFLSEINLPDTTEYIGQSAFYNCRSLETVKIKSKSIKIDYHAFKYCGRRLQLQGYAGSDVESYAKSKDFDFVRIEE